MPSISRPVFRRSGGSCSSGRASRTTPRRWPNRSAICGRWGVFRRVKIDTVRTDSGLVAKVLTKDGWSTQIDYRFRSAGGQIEFTIGLIESNLLGTASTAAVRYRKLTDRSTVALGFRRPRLFAGRVGLSAAYEDRSDGRLGALVLEQPFFSLTTHNAFSVSGEDHDERVLRYSSGERVASDTLTRRYTIGRAAAAWALSATERGFLRLGGQVQVRRDDFGARRDLRPASQHGDGGRRAVPGLEPGELSGGPRHRWIRAGGRRRPRRHRPLRSHGGAQGVRLRSRRHRAASHRALRRPHPVRLRVRRGAGGRTVQLRGSRLRVGRAGGDNRAPAHSPPGGGSCTSRAGGSGIRSPARSSIWDWARDRARSGATPSPATVSSSRPRSIA